MIRTLIVLFLLFSLLAPSVNLYAKEKKGAELIIQIADLQQASSSFNTADWLIYRNDSYGFSFHYPKNLLVIQRNPEDFGIKNLVFALDIREQENPKVIILRILLKVPETKSEDSPKIPLPDINFYKKVCKKYKEFRLDNRTAINCVTCGSAACHWQVHVLCPNNLFSILTLISDESMKDGPEDGTYPILTIINTLCFD